MTANALLPTVRLDMFFRPEAIRKAKDRAAMRYLMRAGGKTRLTAKRSMRKRKKVSQPGQPPSSHVGTLRRGIFFGLERTTETVTIGPEPKATQIAGLLEHGGTTTRRGRRGRMRRVTIRPRPFMRPALEKITPSLPKMWADSVR